MIQAQRILIFFLRGGGGGGGGGGNTRPGSDPFTWLCQ